MGLYMWWATAAGLGPDSLVQFCWDAMRGHGAADIPQMGRLRQPKGRQAGALGIKDTEGAAWSETSEAAERQAKLDSVAAHYLRVDLRRLRGTNIAAQTGRALQLTTAKVQSITEVSADGIYFPKEPTEFKEEVRRQAKELYGSREGINMQSEKMLQGGYRGRSPSKDVPDFQTQMDLYLQPDCMCQDVGGSPSIEELSKLIKRGSTATSMDELPRGVIQHLPGHGLHALRQVLVDISDGMASELLNSVLHIPLRKKEPAWLIRNSRPIMLEPYVRRVESCNVFQRMQRRLEANRSIPSCMGAYRRQLSPQRLALTVRWFIAVWASMGSDVFIGDWDEENAFCNVPRDGCAEMAGGELPGFAPCPGRLNLET